VLSEVRVWNKLGKTFDRTAVLFHQSHVLTLENTRRYLRADDVVLDFGCATGEIEMELARGVRSIHGIDISPVMIEQALGKAAEQQLNNVSFQTGTIFEPELAVSTYDVVLAFNILHFMNDRIQVLNQISLLLKPGGLFISVSPCMGDSLDHGLLVRFMNLFIGIPFIDFFTARELKHDIESTGFEILEQAHFSRTEYFISARKPGEGKEPSPPANS